ncbi:protein of unknown function [Methylorubrum extorquens]|uniref:Uncharacterized protein n=1 Tax=Methylorubrum extorquens TaxID=408 RepID=A0A2N9AWD1_METEX|nr:protein of unknown function [Methylorubrum extorquens]
MVLVFGRIPKSNRRQRTDIKASAHATATQSDSYDISGAFSSKGAYRDEIRSKVPGLHQEKTWDARCQ